MTALPADWFPGDKLPAGAVNGSYDWTGGDVTEPDKTSGEWDDVLDGPVYPARSFCTHDGHCYEEQVSGGAYCRRHSYDPTKEAA